MSKKAMDQDHEVPFAVPGEPHENLPAGGFAGYGRMGKSHLGAASRTVKTLPLYTQGQISTDGGGVFGAQPFGNTMVGVSERGMGDIFSDLWTSSIQPALTAGATRAGGELLSAVGQKIMADPMVQQTTAQKALETAGQTFAEQAKKAAELASKYKYYLIAGGVAVSVLAIYLVIRKK